MNKSVPILPLRFYDDLYDQSRFSTHCKNQCQLDLVYPANELPFFQFIRKSKFQTPTNFYLRKTCTDIDYNFYKSINENSNNFGNVNQYGAFPKTQTGIDSTPPGSMGIYDVIKIDCGKAMSVPLPANVTLQTPNASIVFPIDGDPVNIKFKIIVDTLVIAPGSSFSLRLYNDNTLFAIISQPGTFIYTVYNGNSTGEITMEVDNYGPGDSFSISYASATTDFFGGLFTGDIQLSVSDLKTFPMADGRDIIVFCKNYQSFNVPEGEYYYVVDSGGDYYFSEVFTIKNARDIEKYYKLTWYNDCDINNHVIYSRNTLDGCFYQNRLYLEAGLFNPEYNTVEQGEEDGVGTFTATFQKWQKNLNFEIPKCPEFLTDALSAVFMHKYVFVRKPLNYKQEELRNEYQVLRTVPDIQSVLDDCFQRVNLKFLLSDMFTDSACCNDADIFDCTPCKYVSTSCAGGGAYELVLQELGAPVGPYGLYNCATGGLMSDVRESDIICHNGKYYQIKWVSPQWVLNSVMPSIAQVLLVFIFYTVTGKVIPYSFGTLQYQYNGGAWTNLDTIQGDANGQVDYVFPLFLITGASSFKIRIHCKTLNCDFGYSDETVIV